MTAHPIPLAEYRSERSRSASATRGPRILPLLVFAAAVVALFFAMIYLRISLDQTAFELDRIERSIEVEQSRQRDLRYDLASLQDPLRIATEAQRIGLVFPDERITILVERAGPDAQTLTPEVPVRAMNGDRP